MRPQRIHLSERSFGHIQLLFKSLNTPAGLLGQLRQSISVILRLYACSTSTILIVSVQRPYKMQVRIFNNDRITNKKNAMVSVYQNTKLHFTLAFKLLSSNCSSYTESKRASFNKSVKTGTREMFSQKSVRRFVGDSSAFVMGAMFLASALNRSISPWY